MPSAGSRFFRPFSALSPLWLALLCTPCLTGCIGNPARGEAGVLEFDLGSPPAFGQTALPIASATVQAVHHGPEDRAQIYRLLYAAPQERRRYAQNRWTAPPPQLLAAFLRQGYGLPPAGAVRMGCGIHLALDTFEQQFDDPAQSAMVLEARAALLPPEGKLPLAERHFRQRIATVSPHARGGAAAARQAAIGLATALQTWMQEVAESSPGGAAICGPKSAHSPGR